MGNCAVGGAVGCNPKLVTVADDNARAMTSRQWRFCCRELGCLISRWVAVTVHATGGAGTQRAAASCVPVLVLVLVLVLSVRR